MGIARDMQPCLFALFLLKTVDADHIRGMLKTFFKTVLENQPETIITENTLEINRALS